MLRTTRQFQEGDIQCPPCVGGSRKFYAFIHREKRKKVMSMFFNQIVRKVYIYIYMVFGDI
jgi:hypothetical protein